MLDIKYEDDPRPGMVEPRACVVFSGMRVTRHGDEERVLTYSTCQGIASSTSYSAVRDEFHWTMGYIKTVYRGVWRVIAASLDLASAFPFLDAFLTTMEELRN